MGGCYHAFIYLPKGSPYLNAVEECWHQGKRILLVSEYYRTFADMCNAIITYYRTVRSKLDIVQRCDPQLRIEPSMPIILQICVPKHATFV